MRLRRFILPSLVVIAVSGLVAWTSLGSLARIKVHRSVFASLDARLDRNLELAVDKVDHLFQARWSTDEISPAEPADELQVLRRLSLALVGRIPSLAEIREFEADTSPDRLRRWTVRWMADPRFADYFAERLAVSFVGTFEQDVPLFTHARFEAWLSDQIAAGRPYDEMVREMISATGPPTSNRAANFVSAEVAQGELFANRLAARTARAFLGQRIDCAECHDHPFDHWKQSDFQGLAAHFAQLQTGPLGIHDDADRQHLVEDRKTLEKHVVDPHVPFHSEWLNEADSRRLQLAQWITHRENQRFLRAISNRVWGLMFGRPFISPVDSIPDPREPRDRLESDGPVPTDPTELLDVLADDLRDHQYDLRRLILVITSSRPFRLASTHPTLDTDAHCKQLTDSWAIFPLVQWRPEQLVRSLEQAATLRSLPANENVYTLVRREQWMRKFVEQYGSLGENELDYHTDSIPHMIHRMHSRFTAEKCRAEWTNAVGRIAATAPSESVCLDVCYLVCLTRRPTEAEREHFLPQFLDSHTTRSRVVEDVFWTLFNSPEFGWNH